MIHWVSSSQLQAAVEGHCKLQQRTNSPHIVQHKCSSASHSSFQPRQQIHIWFNAVFGINFIFSNVSSWYHACTLHDNVFLCVSIIPMLLLRVACFYWHFFLFSQPATWICVFILLLLIFHCTTKLCFKLSCSTSQCCREFLTHHKKRHVSAS